MVTSIIPAGRTATQEEVLAFVRSTISSVWVMELLLLLHGNWEREWTAEQLVHQLRASETVVSSALRRFHAAGIVMEAGRNAYRYRGEVERIDDIVATLDSAYLSNPVSVVKMIAGTLPPKSHCDHRA